MAFFLSFFEVFWYGLGLLRLLMLPKHDPHPRLLHTLIKTWQTLPEMNTKIPSKTEGKPTRRKKDRPPEKIAVRMLLEILSYHHQGHQSDNPTKQTQD
jgi:hypothetical protein